MKKWKKYEKQVYKELALKFPECKLKADDSLPGRFSNCERQIDISIKGKIAYKKILGVVDCKCFSEKIDVNDVETFIGMLDDVNAEFGILITTEGFSQAAKNRAKAAKIELVIIKYEEIDEYNFAWLFSSLHVDGNLEYMCDNCKKKLITPSSDLIFEVQDVEERGMGPETWHNTIIQHDCSKCHNEIKIVYDVWEYPMGAINLVEIEPDSVTILKEPYLECKV